MDLWFKAANCETRSEFIDKALVFYIGCLETNRICNRKKAFI